MFTGLSAADLEDQKTYSRHPFDAFVVASLKRAQMNQQLALFDIKFGG